MNPQCVARRRTRLAAAIAASAAAVLAPPLTAWAQPGPEGRGPGGPGDPGRRREGTPFGALLQPEFLRRDMTLMLEYFDLDQPQVWIVETLLSDYETAFSESAAAMTERYRELRGGPRGGPDGAIDERDRLGAELRRVREELRALREATPEGQQVDAAKRQQILDSLGPLREQLAQLRPPAPDAAEMAALAALNAEWSAQRAELRTDLLESVRSILDDRQLALWDEFERTLRRQKTLGRGRLSGESVDLFVLADQIVPRPEDQARIEPALREYTAAMDKAIAAREHHLEGSQTERVAAMFNRDTERAEALAARELELRLAVRDVNHRSAETIAEAIAREVSPQTAEAFRAEYRRLAYPRVFRPTRTQRAFETALEMDDLGDAVRGGVQSLQSSYLVELASANAVLEETIRAREPAQVMNQSLRVPRGRGARPDDEEEENPIRSAFQARSDLDLRYRAQLDALLTPEQVARLPQAVDRRPPGPPESDERGDRVERRRRLLERFDEDGDGQLSDQEREKAREFFRNREEP